MYCNVDLCHSCLDYINISYGRLDHEDWCTHKSMLCTWNIDRRKIDANKADVAIDLPSCVMCVACHPTQPSWIAGGTFSGRETVQSCVMSSGTVLSFVMPRSGNFLPSFGFSLLISFNFTARCHASILYAVVMCLSVCLSVCHKPVF